MCKQASFVIYRDPQTEEIKALFSKYKDSHTEILKEYGIKEDYKEPQDCDFVRIEIVPENNDITVSIDKWVYTVDEPNISLLPQWYKESANWCEKLTRDSIHDYLKTRITQGDAIGADKSIMTGGYSATMAGGDSATMTGGDSATMTGGESATMTGGNSATMTGGYYAKMTGGNYAKFKGGLGAYFICLGDTIKTKKVAKKDVGKFFKVVNNKWEQVEE